MRNPYNLLYVFVSNLSLFQLKRVLSTVQICNKFEEDLEAIIEVSLKQWKAVTNLYQGWESVTFQI